MRDDKKIRLAGVTPESVVDGLGLRFVIWAQGCKHQCPGCHSPFTWDFEGGELQDMDALVEKIRKNPILKGITCSGGDPMEQADKFAYIAGRVKSLSLDVWCYTGYTIEFILENMDSKKGWRDFLVCVDVLVDGCFEKDRRDMNLPFRGSSNQRIIDVQESLKKNKAILLSL